VETKWKVEKALTFRKVFHFFNLGGGSPHDHTYNRPWMTLNFGEPFSTIALSVLNWANVPLPLASRFLVLEQVARKSPHSSTDMYSLLSTFFSADIAHIRAIIDQGWHYSEKKHSHNGRAAKEAKSQRNRRLTEMSRGTSDRFYLRNAITVPKTFQNWHESLFKVYIPRLNNGENEEIRKHPYTNLPS